MALVMQLNNRQWSSLEGLAAWVADGAYIAEYYGIDDPEWSKCDSTVKACFDTLDRLGVPYWVQNAVISWARDWRAYKAEYMDCALQRRRYGVDYIGGGSWRITCGEAV